MTVPMEMDRKAVLAVDGLASTGIRSFELWWDGDEKRLLAYKEQDDDDNVKNWIDYYEDS